MESYDVDGNGSPDLLIPLLGGGIAIIWNRSLLPGSFAFQPQTVAASSASYVQARIADFDHSGLPDLLTMDSTGEFQIRLQTTPGAFSEAVVSLPGLIGTGSFFLDQVNSDDSTLDLLLASDYSGGMSAIWFEEALLPWNNAAESLLDSPWADRPDRAEFSHAVLADLDGNGQNDIIAADRLSAGLHVYMHYPQLDRPQFRRDQFGKPIPLPQDRIYPESTSRYRASLTSINSALRPLRIAVGQLDEDGLQDLAVIYRSGNNHSGVESYHFSDPELILSEELPSYLLLLYRTKLEDDNTDHPVASLEFRLALHFPVSLSDLRLADVDNDGDMDILACGEQSGTDTRSYFLFYEALQPYVFAEPVAHALADHPLRMEAQDFDGDGYVDVAVLCPFTNSLGFLRNSGASTNPVSGPRFIPQPVLAIP
ncbi:VCBS repeat-containing protein [bacterium]|nr:VCBS repeat-containing protein [bacterium]